MTTYRVEIDGNVVWSDETAEDLGAAHFPAEYLNRPADPAPGDPFPPKPHLYFDGELIGVQHCMAEELAIEAEHQAAIAAAAAAKNAGGS